MLNYFVAILSAPDIWPVTALNSFSQYVQARIVHIGTG